MSKIRVVIFCPIIPGELGGVEHFIRGLLAGLVEVSDPSFEYIILVKQGYSEWASELVGKKYKVVAIDTSTSGRLIEWLRPFKKMLAPLFSIKLWLDSFKGIQLSNGFIESFEPSVVHFPYQFMLRLKNGIPTIFNPHDLQHEHLPGFFDPFLLRWRKKMYRLWSDYASYIATESEFVKSDLMATYQIEEKKIFPIHRGAPISSNQDISITEMNEWKKKYGLPDQFILFPAQTWPHKNHLRLVEAIYLIKKKHQIEIKVMCTGKKNFHLKNIQTRIKDLGVEDLFIFPGFLSFQEIPIAFKASKFVVFPTLFEGGGFPVVEAMMHQKPIACSDIPPLKEIASEYAVFFDPNDNEDIAEKIHQLFIGNIDEKAMQNIGRKILNQFSWSGTAKAYNDLYLKAASNI